MSVPKEIKELQDKRTKLEDESRSLKEEQKTLEEKVKALEQKTIEELKNTNKTTHQAISKLESMVNELEQRLSQFSQSPEPSQTEEETTSKSYLKKCTECGKDIPIASEECQYCGAKQMEIAETTVEPASDAGEVATEQSEEGAVTVEALEDSTMVAQDAIGEKLGTLNEKRKAGFLQTLFK